ncbi:MAG: thioesterase family protein [Bacteroidaceae bacterium]
MKIGLTHTSSTTVDETNTAQALGSGDMEVFATPAMIALMENAAMLSVFQSLPKGSTTVGAAIDAKHSRPSKIGAEIRATATLINIEGRKLTFRIKAEDSKEMIGEATHIRYIVDRERFLSK